MNNTTVDVSPFKLLNPYEQGDVNIFFGRETEIRQLADALMHSKFLLIYGASGTGKTSLIQCGLPGMFSPRDWLPVFVRRGENFIDSLFEIILGQYSYYFQLNFPNKTPNLTRNISLRNIIKELFNLSYLPVYLIFDQFEEIFTLGTVEEQFQFFRELDELHLFDEDLFCKVLLVTREEYIAYFYRHEKKLPFLFEHRFRIEKMRREQLFIVVNSMINIKYPNFLPIQIEESASEQILDNLTDERGEVDLTTLQVYLDRLYRKDLEQMHGVTRDHVLFNSTLIGKNKLQNVLSDFLDRQVTIVNQHFTKENSENFTLQILFKLVTNQGVKRNLSASTIHKELSIGQTEIDIRIVENCLNQLAASDIRLVNRLRFAKTTEEHFEIVHDRLAEQVFAKFNSQEITQREAISAIEIKQKRYLTTKEYLSLGELELVEKSLRIENLNKEQEIFYKQSKLNQKRLDKKKKKEMFFISFIAIVFAIIAIFTYIFYYDAQSKKLEAQLESASYVNPTAALTLAKKAWERNPSEQILRSVSKIIYKQTLYCDHVSFFIKNIHRIKKTNYKQLFLGVSRFTNNSDYGDVVFLSDHEGKKIFEYVDDCGIIDERLNIRSKTITFSNECGYEKEINFNGTLLNSREKKIVEDQLESSAYLMGISNSGKEKVYQQTARGEGAFLGKSGKITKEFVGMGKICFVSFSKNDRYLALGWIDMIQILDKKRELINEIIIPDGKTLASMAISPLGDKIAAGFSEGDMYVWNIGTDNQSHKIATTEVLQSISFSDNNNLIITASINGQIRMWNLNSRQNNLVQNLPLSNDVPMFSHDSRFIKYTFEYWGFSGNNEDRKEVHIKEIKKINSSKNYYSSFIKNKISIRKYFLGQEHCNDSYYIPSLGTFKLINGEMGDVKLVNNKGVIICDFGLKGNACFSPNGEYVIIFSDYIISPATFDFYQSTIFQTPWDALNIIQMVQLSDKEKLELGFD